MAFVKATLTKPNSWRRYTNGNWALTEPAFSYFLILWMLLLSGTNNHHLLLNHHPCTLLNWASARCSWMHPSSISLDLFSPFPPTTLTPWFSYVFAAIVCLGELNYRHCLSCNPLPAGIKFNSIQFTQFTVWSMTFTNYAQLTCWLNGSLYHITRWGCMCQVNHW